MAMSGAIVNQESLITSNATSTPTMMSGKYHDYANESINEDELRAERPVHGSALGQMFPLKLHYMLSDIEAEGLSHIVAWRPHGRCFAVLNQKEFVAKMLPLWFQQTKFASFQRQLNLYCFRRITQGPDKGCYYHEFFLRGKQSLCCRIKRMKVKGSGHRKKGTCQDEPNFSDFAPLPSTSSVIEGTGQGIRARLEHHTENSHSHPALVGQGPEGGGKINKSSCFLDYSSSTLPVVSLSSTLPMVSLSQIRTGAAFAAAQLLSRELDHQATKYRQQLDAHKDALKIIQTGSFTPVPFVHEGPIRTVSAASSAFLSACAGPPEWWQPKSS